ncbi:MAG: S24 family peptidase [Pseudomonadota bacterium]
MGLFHLIRVEGDSMARRLPHGSYALFRFRWRLRPRQIVLVHHPKFGRIVKQITAFEQDGVRLRGLNAQSTSEDDLGVVSRSAVEGVLLWSMKPVNGSKDNDPLTEEG